MCCAHMLGGGRGDGEDERQGPVLCAMFGPQTIRRFSVTVCRYACQGERGSLVRRAGTELRAMKQ